MPKGNTEFKRIKTIKLKNVNIDAEWEYQLDPWMVMYTIGFYVMPTELAKTDLEDVRDYHAYLANELLGKRVLERELVKSIPFGWALHSIAYPSDHDLHMFSFDKATKFEIDLDVIAPEDYSFSTTMKDIDLAVSRPIVNNFKKEIEALGKKIAQSKCFQNDKYVIFSSKKPN